MTCPACCHLRQLNAIYDRKLPHLEHELEPSPEYFPVSHGKHPDPPISPCPVGHEVREQVLLDKGGDWEEVGVRLWRVRIGEGVVCDVDC